MSDCDPSDMSPREGCPVHDWATDFEVMDEGYIKDPAPVWEELREKCPISPYHPLGRGVAADEI